MRRLLILFALPLALGGCQTAMTPGSAYRLTGSVVSLVAEPTFDIGMGPPEGNFYSFNVPHYDADGHGLYDVPIVAAEQLMFAPVWLFSAALRLSAGEYFMAASQPPGQSALNTGYWYGREGLGWLFIVPGMVCYAAGFVGAMAFDIVAHDAPVIVFGLPKRLWRFASSLF